MPRRSINKSVEITSYEKDLTYMAMRYAVCRSTISCTQLAKDMAKHLFTKMSTGESIMFALDIKKQIEEKLRFMPFSFSVNFAIDRGSSDYAPLDKFIEWMDDNNIDTSEDLRLWEEIIYVGKGKYTAYQVDHLSDRYVTESFDNLIVWNRLAKLMDFRCHKFCIIRNEKNEEEMVEYFEDYERTSSKILSYKKIKVPVIEYAKNPYVLSDIIKEDNILEEVLSDNEVKEYCKEHFMGYPKAIEIKYVD